MSAQRRHPRRFQTGRSAAHDQNPMRCPGAFQRRKFGFVLVTGGRVVGTTQAWVLHQADQVVLIGEQARANVGGAAFTPFVWQVRISDQRSGHFHRVGFPVSQQRRRHFRIDDAALGENRQRDRRLDARRQMHGEAGRLI